MNAKSELTQVVIDQLTANTEPWLSCDDCFEQADLAIENLLGDQVPFSEEFRVHLQACAVCHEEAESLTALVAADHGLSEEQGIAQVEKELSRSTS
jgi:hypothetical protein